MPHIKPQIPVKLGEILLPYRYKVVRGGRGSTKCLGLGTPILMFDGTIKAVEDVKSGDLVMGPDSKPRTVLSTTTGESQLYRVDQTSAMSYVVNDNHVLSLKKSKSSTNDTGISSAGNPRRPRGRYPDWPEITNIPIEDYLSQSKRWKDNFRGYRAGIIEFPRQDVPVDPYLLGLWLGDGLHRELMITTPDQEIKDWLKEFAEEKDLTYTEGGKTSTTAKDIRLARDPKLHGRSNPVWQGFKALDVVSNKHIPQIYITNDKETRLRLLAGLIDTDGTYVCHGYVIVSAREILASGIKRLADSLGFRTSITKKATKCGSFRGTAWRIAINGDVWDIPCRIERKKYQHNGIKPNKDKTLSYLSVEPLGPGKYAGFEVDGDSLFCLADGTVTHNSWSFARVLLVFAAERPLRILCTREIQKSIKQSVHQLLKDQITLLGLDAYYIILESEIRGVNGSLFSFVGLSDLTVDSIKSYEGFDICWVEEGQTIIDRSWKILIPTIRKPGSEIWISYNPDLETDPTHKRFTLQPPPDTLNIEMNWCDNPWWSPLLEAERLHCLETDPDSYENIWEGKCRPAVEGAIYHRQIQDVEASGRVCNVPYDPFLLTHVVLDLGWDDSLAVSLIQRHASEIRFIEYLEYSHTTLPAMSQELKKRNYNWGKVWLPHDGYNASLNSNGLSTFDILTSLGWVCSNRDEIIEMSVEDGIRHTRTLFPRMYFDAAGCGAEMSPQSTPEAQHTGLSHRLIECIKRYRRRVNKVTDTTGAPLKDQHTHGADNIRYVALAADLMEISAAGGQSNAGFQPQRR